MGKADNISSPDGDEKTVELIDSIDDASSYDMQYDQSGLRGILRSPYVFGAGLLASFGGFSFGYGMRTMSYPH